MKNRFLWVASFIVITSHFPCLICRMSARWNLVLLEKISNFSVFLHFPLILCSIEDALPQSTPLMWWLGCMMEGSNHKGIVENFESKSELQRQISACTQHISINLDGRFFHLMDPLVYTAHLDRHGQHGRWHSPYICGGPPHRGTFLVTTFFCYNANSF